MQKYTKQTVSGQSRSNVVMHFTKHLHFIAKMSFQSSTLLIQQCAAFRKTAHLLQSTKGQESQEQLF